MRHRVSAAVLCTCLLILPARAETDHQAIAERALRNVILPSAAAFAAAAEELNAATSPDCTLIEPDAVRALFHATWDAWMGLQHLGFGPLEEDNRAQQVAFWPDARGKTGRAVARLLKKEDPVVDDAEAFASISVAARGLLAMERLLYDENGIVELSDPYRCRYLDAAATDLARISSEIDDRWRNDWAILVLSAGSAQNAEFLGPDEVTRRIYASLLGALTDTVKNRLARPLGTLEKRRPRLAEAWRSGRSLRQIRLLADATGVLLQEVFADELDPETVSEVALAIARVEGRVVRVEESGALPDAIETVPIRVETLLQGVEQLSEAFKMRVGPELGLVQGFNASDGD